jgi:hypothetical protein
MIKVDSEQDEKKEKAEAPKQDATAGSSAPNESQKLADEAEAFCMDLEKFFRRAFGDVPKASDLGQIRAQQAVVRDLVHSFTVRRNPARAILNSLRPSPANATNLKTRRSAPKPIF